MRKVNREMFKSLKKGQEESEGIAKRMSWERKGRRNEGWNDGKYE